MHRNLNELIILGHGYSGSGLIFDYLKNNDNFFDVFNSFEFRLIQDPGGILTRK